MYQAEQPEQRTTEDEWPASQADRESASKGYMSSDTFYRRLRWERAIGLA
jgi:hypothetical protein